MLKTLNVIYKLFSREVGILYSTLWGLVKSLPIPFAKLVSFILWFLVACIVIASVTTLLAIVVGIPLSFVKLALFRYKNKIDGIGFIEDWVRCIKIYILEFSGYSAVPDAKPETIKDVFNRLLYSYPKLLGYYLGISLMGIWFIFGNESYALGYANYLFYKKKYKSTFITSRECKRGRLMQRGLLNESHLGNINDYTETPLPVVSDYYDEDKFEFN